MLNQFKKIASTLVLLNCTVLLSACNGFFEKDNTPTPTPLVNFRSQVQTAQLWRVKTGSGEGDETIKMTPALGANAVFTSGVNGIITSINRANGGINWQTATRLPLSTGPGVGDGIVVVGSRRGDIIALRQTNGMMLWKSDIADEVLANPVISHGQVIIKALDGHIHALSVTDGHVIWTYKQAEPTLVLRGSSNPVVVDNDVIAGFANGNLVKLMQADGQLVWQQTVAIPDGAFAIERMIDIDANPVVYQHNIYAATYQGKISSIDWRLGDIRWAHDISSYTGMVADENGVFITDAKGYFWGFNAHNGNVNWRQDKLKARILSAPVDMGPYVVVGDAEGYLHWLSKQDGHFTARQFAGAPIYATPIVENHVLYVLTNNGYLVAYSMS